MTSWVFAIVMLVVGSSCEPGQRDATAVARCAGARATITGTSERDVLRGTPQSDVIVGLGGDDDLVGLAGGDLICGGSGNDHLIGNEGVDALIGGYGEDRCDPAPDAGTRRTCEDPTIIAAGDIACSPDTPDFDGGAGTETACRQRDTAQLVDANSSTLVGVLALGDLQYEEGSLDAFLASFDPTWGLHKSLMHPVPGNNEYETPDAAGYFAYFGRAAGLPDRGFYSFDLEGWHFVALNSLCWRVGGCGIDQAQATWLAEDLALNDSECTIAFFHHPRFSSSAPIPNDSVEPIWRVLYEARVDLVLNGHNHNYERFAPQSPNGDADPVSGIREFVVGTGGVSLHAFPDATPPRANSAVREDGAFGVLEITLHPASYEWRFIPLANATFVDAGMGDCI